MGDANKAATAALTAGALAGVLAAKNGIIEAKNKTKNKNKNTDIKLKFSDNIGKLIDPDTVAREKGYANYDELMKYKQENPELYNAMGGVKYGPIEGSILEKRVFEVGRLQSKAKEKIIERISNSDIGELQKSINAMSSGVWQDADTAKKHSDRIDTYVDDWIALENMGYFNYISDDDRKGYISALKSIKNTANKNKNIFADYKDADSYKSAINNYIEYEKVKNGNYEELEAELKGWEKEWNTWNEGTNSTLGDKEWIMQEWRFNNDGQRTIPYNATSYPEVFMGKTITEAEEIINKRKYFLRLVQKDNKIENLANEAKTNVNFNKISSYKICNTEKELLKKYDTQDFDSNNIDLLVDYLCTDSKEVRDSITNHKYTSYLEIYGVSAAERVSLLNFDWSQKGYDQLNDDEKKIVKYYAKYDTTKLYEYLSLNEENWKNRGAKIIADSIDGNVLAQASYAIAGAGDRIKQSAVGALNYIAGKEDYVEPTKTQLTSQYIRQNIDGFGGFLYDAVDAVTYMTPSILMNAMLPGSGFVVAGITAAGSGYNDGIRMGMTKSQARTYGTLISVSESLLSKIFSGVAGLKGSITKISAEKISSGINNGILKFVSTIGVNSVSEGIEEFAQEALEPLFENISLGYDKNDWDDIDWEDAVYNGLIGAFLGSTSNISTSINDGFDGRNKIEKFNPDEFIAGMWEDAPNTSKNGVEKSRLESVENTDENGIIKKVKVLTLDDLTRDVLRTKPLYSPVPEKWIQKGGSIAIADDGDWIYTNSDGISVKYIDGYPDFKGAGLVMQEVDVGEFINRSVDKKKARELVEQNPNTEWHHPPNSNKLQEINADIHKQFTHIGGIAKNRYGE